MKTVSEDNIVEVWERQCALNKQETRALVQQFMEEQPAVGAYLVAHTEDLGDEASESFVLPLAATVWEALTLTRGSRLETVTPEVLDRADAANIEMLEELDEGSENGWHDHALQLMTEYNQQPLLAFCLEILLADDEATPELAPERIGLEFLWLKTVIDCFDR